MTEPADLITQARDLGRAHRTEGIHPFGPVEFIRWDEGSGDLLAALGQTAPTSADNHYERVRIVVAYCDALAGIGDDYFDMKAENDFAADLGPEA